MLLPGFILRRMLDFDFGIKPTRKIASDRSSDCDFIAGTDGFDRALRVCSDNPGPTVIPVIFIISVISVVPVIPVISVIPVVSDKTGLAPVIVPAEIVPFIDAFIFIADFFHFGKRCDDDSPAGFFAFRPGYHIRALLNNCV